MEIQKLLAKDKTYPNKKRAFRDRHPAKICFSLSLVATSKSPPVVLFPSDPFPDQPYFGSVSASAETATTFFPALLKALLRQKSNPFRKTFNVS